MAIKKNAKLQPDKENWQMTGKEIMPSCSAAKWSVADNAQQRGILFLIWWWSWLSDKTIFNTLIQPGPGPGLSHAFGNCGKKGLGMIGSSASAFAGQVYADPGARCLSATDHVPSEDKLISSPVIPFNMYPRHRLCTYFPFFTYTYVSSIFSPKLF